MFQWSATSDMEYNNVVHKVFNFVYDSGGFAELD